MSSKPTPTDLCELAATGDLHQFAQVLSVLPVAVYLCDEAGRITFFNKRAEDIWGRTPSLHDDAERFCGSFRAFAPDGTELDRDQTPMARAVRFGESTSGCEVEIERPDGSRVIASVEISPLFDAQGAVCGAINVFTDVTERKRAEQASIHQARSLELLNRVGHALTAELHLERLVQAITDAATEVSGAKFGAFFYNKNGEEGARGSYSLFTISGVSREHFEGFGVPRNTPLFEPTFRGERVRRIPDVTADSDYGRLPPFHGMPPGHLPVRSYLAAPVVSRTGEVLGGLFFGHPETDIFTEESERLVCAIASQAAIAIENAHLYEKAQNEIAQHKRTEAALRESEARFQALMENSSAVIYAKDLEGCYILANEAFRRRLELDPDDVVGRRDTDLFSDDLAQAIRKNDLQVLESAGPMEFEELIPHSDGPHTYFSVKFPLRRGDGSIYAVAGISSDITVRKREAQDSRRLAAIVESSDDAIVSKTLQGIITSWNRGAERIFGYQADEMVGQSIIRIIPPDRRDEEERILENIRSGRTIEHYETVRIRKDGSSVPVSLTVSAVRNGEGAIVGASKIAREISSRKAAETRQQVLFDLVAAVNRADSLPAIFGEALNGICRCQNVERATLHLFEASSTTMALKEARGIGPGFRCGAAAIPALWTVGTKDGVTPILWHARNGDRLDGQLDVALREEGVHSAAFIPLTYENRLLGQMGVYFDKPRDLCRDEVQLLQAMASQVAFAVERQSSADSLERLVSERTASLRDAIAQMEEFAYTVSHDLRAPLRSMQVFADALVEDFGPNLVDEARQYLSRIAFNANRLDRMIMDVLAFSRVARGAIQLEPVSLNAVIESIVETYPVMQPPHASVEVEPLADVIAHEPSLAQALTNLLHNAVKFVAPGVKPEVRIRAERLDGQVRVYIRDNGIGIDPKHQARLFNMFERLNPKQDYDGTGVGLAIVRKGIERMGGRVGAYSDGLNGSEFWLELPEATGRISSGTLSAAASE